MSDRAMLTTLCAILAACVIALVVLFVLLARSEATCVIVGYTAKGEAVFQCYDPTPTPGRFSR